MKCKVKSITPLACNTYRVFLETAEPVEFKAGQYLMVVMGEKDKRPFSIANSPSRSKTELELHIGAAEHNAYAIEVIEQMKEALAVNSSIEIDVPHGEAYFQEESDNDILLIAGGTGFSYVYSILNYCLDKKVPRSVSLYWGAKDSDQLYALEELKALFAQHPQVKFVPVIEEEQSEWDGQIGNVLQAVNNDFSSLDGFDIYIAGRFDMAADAREQFTLNKKASRERMFGDAYSFI